MTHLLEGIGHETRVELRTQPAIVPIDHTPLRVVDIPSAICSEQKREWVGQVAGYVREHNEKYPGTMYERPEDELLAHFERGNAVVLLEDERVAYYGLVLEQFNQAQQEALGGRQLVEFANSIVRSDLRKAGVGAIGTIERFKRMRTRWGDQSVGYLTTENAAIKRLYEKTGPEATPLMEAVDWEDFPYLAGLTCAYSARGLDDGHSCEQKRRAPNTEHAPEPTVLISEQGAREGQTNLIPCTLLVSSKEAAADFQCAARRLHVQRGGEPVEVPLGSRLTTDDVLRVYSFYQGL